MLSAAVLQSSVALSVLLRCTSAPLLVWHMQSVACLDAQDNLARRQAAGDSLTADIASLQGRCNVLQASNAALRRAQAALLKQQGGARPPKDGVGQQEVRMFALSNLIITRFH